MSKRPENKLSDLLRRGDPARGSTEVRPAQERSDELLARCALDTSTFPTERRHPFTPRWRFRALAGAGAALAAAGAAMLGFILHSPRSVPPRTQVAVLADRRPAPEPYRPVPTPTIAAAAVVPRKIRRQAQPVTETVRPAGDVAVSRARRKRIYVRPAPLRPPVLTTPSPGLPVPRKVASPSPYREPEVERVILVQDDTPAPGEAPRAPSLAIVMTPNSESVIRSEESDADLGESRESKELK